MHFSHTVGAQRHVFNDLKTLLAKASPARSGDYLAGLAATSEAERMAARMALQGRVTVSLRKSDSMRKRQAGCRHSRTRRSPSRMFSALLA